MKKKVTIPQCPKCEGGKLQLNELVHTNKYYNIKIIKGELAINIKGKPEEDDTSRESCLECEDCGENSDSCAEIAKIWKKIKVIV